MHSLSDLVSFTQHSIDSITVWVVTPLLILLVGVLLGRVLRNALMKLFVSVEFDKHVSNVFGGRARYGRAVSTLVEAVVYVVAAVWAFVEAGILLYVLEVFGAFLGLIVVISLLLWAVEFLPNLYSGIVVRRRVERGEEVDLVGVRGVVKKVGLLGVVVSADDLEVFIPHRAARHGPT